MRILTLTNLYPNPLQPERGTFNREQLRALTLRHRVEVIAPVAWTEELGRNWRGTYLPADRRTQCDGIRVEHPRFLFPPKILRSWYGHFYRLSVQSAFERARNRFRPDLVFAPWAYPDGWAAVELGHRADLPVVIKVHGSDILTLPAYPARQRRTAEALCRADAVVAVSQDLANHVVQLGADPGRVRVVYDGVDASRFHPGPARLEVGGDPLVLFVGRLVPVKGLDGLLEACTQLAQSGVRFTCGLIGGGPLHSALTGEIRRRGLEGKVRMLGPLPHDSLPEWYRSARVVVLPSHSEGVPTVLLEAAACGTPFVASRVGGIPEIPLRSLDQLVPPGDATALAKALAVCLTAPRRAPDERISPTRRLEDAADDLAKLFHELIAQRRPSTVLHREAV